MKKYLVFSLLTLVLIFGFSSIVMAAVTVHSATGGGVAINCGNGNTLTITGVTVVDIPQSAAENYWCAKYGSKSQTLPFGIAYTPSSTTPIDPITLKWDLPLSGGVPTSYGVRVSLTSNFTSNDIVFTENGIPATMLTIEGSNLQNFLPNRMYFWEANATNGAGTSTWSIPKSFTTTTSTLIPGVPTPAFTGSCYNYLKTLSTETSPLPPAGRAAMAKFMVDYFGVTGTDSTGISGIPSITPASLGDKNSNVLSIQAALSQLGFISSSNITGTFDSSTGLGVKAFQKAQGLTVDGLVGPLTVARLKVAYAAKYTTAAPGSTFSQ